MNRCIKLAKLNLKNYKKLSHNSKIVIIICTILFLIFATLSMGFEKIVSNYSETDTSLREIEIYDDNRGFNDNDIYKISNLAHVEDTYQKFQLLSQSYDFSIGDITISSHAYIEGVNRKYSVISKRTVLSKNNNKYENPIIYGRAFNDTDNKKVVMDENLVYLLDVNNIEEIIGKSISIKLSDVIIENIEVVGVYSYIYGGQELLLKDLDDYEKKSYLGYFNNNDIGLWNPFIFSDDILRELHYSVENVEFNIYDPLFFVDSTNNVSGVCDIISKDYGYEIISMVKIIESKAEVIKVIKIFVYWVTAIIFVIALMNVANTLVLKIGKQAKFTELMYKMGYKPNEIKCLYIIENVIICLQCLLIAFAISFLLCLGLDIFMANAYKEITTYKRFLFLPSFKLLMVYFAIVLGLFIILSFVVVSTQMKRRNFYGTQR